jgi:hypothetical protein
MPSHVVPTYPLALTLAELEELDTMVHDTYGEVECPPAGRKVCELYDDILCGNTGHTGPGSRVMYRARCMTCAWKGTALESRESADDDGMSHSNRTFPSHRYQVKEVSDDVYDQTMYLPRRWFRGFCLSCKWKGNVYEFTGLDCTAAMTAECDVHRLATTHPTGSTWCGSPNSESVGTDEAAKHESMRRTVFMGYKVP